MIAALLIRIAYIQTSDPRSLTTPWSTTTDIRVYDQFGWNLAREATMGIGDRPSAFAMPAYPLFLGAIYRIAGHLPGAVRWVQALLGLLTLFCLGRLARFLAGPRAEMLAVTAGAFYPFFVYFTGEILTESLFVCAFSGMLLSAARVGAEGRTRDGLLHGICLTVAAMTRPVGVFLEPALLILCRPWAAEDRRRRLTGLLLGFLVYGAAWGGWIARNRSVFGETVLFDTHGGFAFYLGHLISIGEKPEEIHRKLGYTHSQVAAGELPGGPRGELEADRRAGEMARRSIREDPARFARAFARNVINLWVGLDFSEVAAETRRIGLTTLVGWVSYGPILLLGLAGLRRLGREGRPALLAVLAVFVTTSLIHGIVLGGQRYRVATLDPILLVLASVEVSGWIPTRARHHPLTPPRPAL
jgi:4-amino-4-deoxy-L-arabinose transferase-like glycosyltransferase